MITETETAFLAVVRAFLTEEKAALEELAALTEKQWNHLFVMAAQHSLLSAVCLLYTSPSPRDRG